MGKDQSSKAPSKSAKRTNGTAKGKAGGAPGKKVMKADQKVNMWKAKSGGTSSKDSKSKGSKFSGKEKSVSKANGDGKSTKGKPTTTNGKTSKITEKTSKAAAKLELVESLKNDWNRIRVRTINPEEKTKLLNKLMASIKGHVLQVTLRHDVSRIVQCILQFGTDAQKSYILNEMSQKIFEICKTPYGHFAVLKAITYCTTPEDQKKIISALTGHFSALGTNVIGSRTVESILQIFPAKLTRGLKAEFYGKNFVILQAEPPRTLRALMEALPTRESAILDHLSDLIQKFINKGLLEFVYVHHLLWEYIQEIQQHEKQKKMDSMVNMLAEAGTKLMVTKPGSKVMCAIASHATAKDRKRILKSLKGHVLESVLHSSAHLAIMRIIDVTDDTVSVQKMLLADIRSMKVDLKYTAAGVLIGKPLPPIVNVALHPQGCKVLLRLLNCTKRVLEPDEEALFATTPATSKKAPALRRKEHLTYLKASLIAACVKYAGVLLRNRNGCRVLQEVVSVFYPQQVLSAIAKAMVGEEVQVDDEMEEEDADEEDVEEEAEDEDDEVEETEPEEASQAMQDDAEEEYPQMDLDENSVDEAKEDEEPAAAVVEEPQLPIAEDINAHQSIRRILEMQTILEGGTVTSANGIQSTVDTELHENDGSFNFAAELLQEIVSHNLLDEWVSCSRGSFAIAQLLQIPSMKTKAKKIVKAKDVKAAVLAGPAVDSPGGKKLLEVV